MTSISGWYLLTEGKKDQILASKYSWMIRNLLVFGNALIDPKKIKKKYVDKVKNEIESALVGQKNEHDKKTDDIATVEKWM